VTRERDEPKSWPPFLIAFGLTVFITALMLSSAAADESGSGTECPSSGSLIRITTASDDNRRSYRPRVSADGTTIVFASDSDHFPTGLSIQCLS
jgi:hypothetical protein